jgi:hypothetical protein
MFRKIAMIAVPTAAFALMLCATGDSTSQAFAREGRGGGGHFSSYRSGHNFNHYGRFGNRYWGSSYGYNWGYPSYSGYSYSYPSYSSDSYSSPSYCSYCYPSYSGYSYSYPSYGYGYGHGGSHWGWGYGRYGHNFGGHNFGGHDGGHGRGGRR